ncbi:bacitracin non-ribosomal peptide synthetase BacA [Bacillus paralicheniformis]|uniref:bacitracin non-ribosomal peptide synthetase BacA n=13 Tax=Bacillus paralicheniformis TaxID=1648923 RepID=UPI002DBBEF6B|nr:bacitracin non-ribosomal peptide synthetase BacA [Bacillus paralicheniformis]MEC1022070.1 bacitracin non-ribosomal peptide synthetase BacA [Bacillus paralicheniformis]MEC1026121.1 bacitracin non-ribosomal peptide synthetase BacA [Bacillus paralicheniformis]MEC1063526.1 bacitracin non-ribosomal peptide synthetase BacA [Bacillus paralicheniformis]MEC1081417.1 bacitracin non-ribosomal peptide synthetase BacA [Bacillus paralicheniformis]MEC1097255.1 bacitracin non-ribosomal peptide synthetase B
MVAKHSLENGVFHKMTENEKELILHFNNTKTDYPKNKTLHELFEEQAMKTPDHTALVFGAQRMTYRELNEKANQTARLLREKGIGKGSIAAIIADRSFEMIIGIIGILKAGGAYLPIDPETPKDRMAFMLSDTKAAVLLTQGKAADGIDCEADIVQLDKEASDGFSKEPLSSVNDSGDTAYIIYTSGSTGTPKGVVTPHYSVIRVVQNTNYIDITEDDVILQLSNYSFDGSVFDIFGALLNGASLVLIEKEALLNINRLGSAINKEKVSVMFITTALFNMIADIHVDCLSNLRKILFGGERASIPHVRKVLNHVGRDKLIHVYGPTESTVYATYYFINEIDDEAETIPIGSPLANTSVLIMDEAGKLLPIGVPGELCIAGDGLSKGYLNQEELTAEKFIPHPFIPGERLYKTGDLAKWLPDGNIEFIGRIDHQVKIRGFRIELGEIESRLEMHEDINETIVIVREDEESRPYICAYITANREISLDELKGFLGEKLPKYMIPAYFVNMDKLPLTKNGKVDRKALPEPDRTAGAESEYEAPQNETEEKLAAIWCDVLHIEKAGIHDHFAQMGGHSLHAMELIAKIKEKMNVEIPLHQLFKLATIKELSAFIEANQQEDKGDGFVTRAADPENIHETFPLTGIQLAYLVGRDETFEIGGVATNLTVEFEADVDLNRFQLTLQKLIDRHPILRTIVFENGTQKILEATQRYTIETQDLRGFTEEEINARILEQREKMTSKIIDPSVWPLFELKTFMLPGEKKYFFLNVDPLICDDSSMKRLIREFKQLYENPGLKLPSLEYSFRDYVLASIDFKQTSRYQKDQQYWLDKLDHFPSAPELPLKSDPAHVAKPSFKKFSTFLDGHTWNELKKKARHHHLTPTSVLCAAYAYILAYWSRQNHFAINLTVFNRIPFHPDVKNMIGDFTSLMLLDIHAEENMTSFWRFALNVQDTLLEALEHRHYDGVDVIRNIAKKNGMNKKAVMPIVFTSVLSENPHDSFDSLVDFDNIHFFSTRTSQVYIDNQVYEINGGLYITWDYVEQIFEHEVIESMFDQYIAIIQKAVSGEDVSTIQMNEKSRQMISAYNDTDQSFDTEPLHELFTGQVKDGPDRMALKHHDEVMTYQELDEKSNQVARFLIGKGVEKGDYIGVIGKRSLGTIVNLLAVLKTGAAYIPLDPDYPEERKAYIQSKSNCKFFISHDVYDKEHIERFSKAPVDRKVDLDDMAYVIFTSGSTGKPKGVQITHGAAANTILDINEKFNVTEQDNIMGISSLCFDLSVYDVFGALSSGASLVIIDDQRDVFSLKETVEKERITIWNSVPAIMGMTADLYKDSELNHQLRLVLLSGDWIPLQLPATIKKTFKNAEVISLGGATEGSIWSIYYPIQKVEEDWKSIPYGKPLANQKIYVLNQNKQLCPVGVEGELYIGGAGVASGYIHDQEKTDHSFIQHQELGYIYKTGDYGVLKEDGYVEFLGRKDSQVKIRGYRVEMGEIENTLLSHQEITKASVIDYTSPDGIKNLYAFVVAENAISQLDVKGFLQKTLPDYMIPAKFVQIDEIPLTVNGKVDKRTLHDLAEQYTADEGQRGGSMLPENETQAMLLEIWKDIFGLDSINLDVSYYEIGGDSLKAISIITEINKRMNVEMPISEIFKNDTIIALDHYLKNREESDMEHPIQKAREKEYYPTSPAQQRMYMLSMLENERGVYHIPMALLVEGRINAIQLENALKTFLQRHEMLRTGFEIQNNELIQKIYENVDFRLEYECLDASITDQHALMEITSTYCKESIKPFDLSRPPLMRAKLIKIEDMRHILVINFHHIISDGVSQGILMNEILELYSNVPLPEVNVQYKDYVEWNHTFNQSDAMKKQEAYWLDVYRDIPSKLDFPYDYKRHHIDTFEGSSVFLDMERELSDHIRKLAKHTGTTLYTVMLSAYYVLLNKYTNQTDIVVGTAAAGRLHPDLQDVFGVFVNTLALRNEVDTSNSFKEFLQQTKERTIAAFDNSEYPFDDLIRKLNGVRESNRNPLFDTMFVLEDARMFTKQKGDVKLSPIIFELDNAKFDMIFNVLDFEEKIVLNIEYSTSLFKEETIQKIAEDYFRILEEVSENLDVALHQIDMISRQEKRILLESFNDTKTAYPKGKAIHQLFEEQAKRIPDHTAVVFENQKLTYRQLNEKANQAARLLREKGVKPDTFVGIMMERSSDMIAAILGVLKAGGAYLPIDPEYPLERMRYMAFDSEVKVIISDVPLAEELTAESIELIHMDDERIARQDRSDIDNVNQSGDLAYVIYTSGSTGKPKGVMIEHQSLINLCSWHQSCFEVGQNDNSSIYASISFDAFVWELFPYITAGATVHVLNQETRLDIEKLNRYFHDHHITISFLPTPVCEQFTALDNHSLRTLLTGGDKLNVFKEKSYQIVNNYGPTENTVVATSFSIDKSHQNIPIGKPIDNVKVYILNKDLQLCPLGASGELCIAGEGLARGYVNRPELTREKFIENPFVPGERMYRTGDLAKMLPDGNIQFLGRIDQQVKIRGYRIEPGEIENRLLKYEKIEEAAVIAREDGDHDPYLCAYVTVKKEVEPEKIRTFLKKSLPDYMIPQHFVQLDGLPLTVNGKVDKKSLPVPERSAAMDRRYEAPRDQVEEKLVSIWEEALGINKIGINSHFFEAGGHSLKAAALVSTIHKELNVKLPLRQIFETPTIKGLREYIGAAKESVFTSIGKTEEKPYYRLSSAQKRLYILSQAGSHVAYNMPFAMTLEGDFDIRRFENTLKNMIKRHESFRTSFVMIDGEVMQQIENEIDFQVAYSDIGKESAEEKIKSFIRPFHLEKAPLLRAEVVKVNEREHLLMFDMHHIISDGVSTDIFVQELGALYEGKSLEPFDIQYKDYAEWENSHARSDELKRQEAYWLKTYKGDIRVLDLPTDHKRPLTKSSEGDTVTAAIESETFRKLQHMAKENGVTMYMLLLAGYTALLSKYTGQEDIIVGTPAAGRNHEDIQHLIGMFVNTLAIRNHPEGKKTFRHYLQEVKENTLQAYENQDYPFEELVEKVNIKRDMARNPLFDTMLVYHNTDVKPFEAKGLRSRLVEIKRGISKFDITVTASEAADGLRLEVEYSTTLFNKERMERLSEHLISLLEQAADHPDVAINQIDVLTKDERHRVLYDFNRTDGVFCKEMTIPELFEKQAEKTPDYPAVAFGDETISYRELNERANSLAFTLRQKGVGPDVIAGILTERSIEMIVGMMGILKAGGAYLPIDPAYPQERISYMLKDSNVSVLCAAGNVDPVEAYAGDIIRIEQTGQNDHVENLKHDIKPQHLAYVIYTSGSTGKPKGVMIEHHSVNNLVHGLNERIYQHLDSHLNVALVAPYIFDASVKQIFAALLFGHTLCIVPRETAWDAMSLIEYYSQNNIHVSDMTPAHLNMLAYLDKSEHEFDLKELIVGGDALTPDVIGGLFHKFPNLSCNITNVYGPTECCVDAASYKIEYGKVPQTPSIPIGRPLLNTSIYIVDKELRPLPVGIAGELCIAGEGVARGYVNRPELTAEKFVDHPFEPGKKMYKTGDLAMWLPDGQIEFLGRADHQVKIRGYRIELGEVEQQLLTHEKIKEAAVIAEKDQNGNSYLCAYIASDKELPAADVRQFLEREMPDYMIPSYFVKLDRLPRTPSGKVDRSALPEADGNSIEGTRYEPPRNEIERKLVQVWGEILGAEDIGISHHFFAAGGDSIKALQIVSRLAKMNLKLEMKALFANPKIKDLSRLITEETRHRKHNKPVTGETELLPIQKRYFTNNKEELDHFNQSFMLFRKDGYDENIVRTAFNKILEQHDALRMIYEEKGGDFIQYNRGYRENLFDLDVYDVRGLDNQAEKVFELATGIQKRSSIRKGKLVHLGIFRADEGDHLLIAIHHLVVDGVSWRILFEDFETLYLQALKGEPLDIGYKTDSYQEFARQLKKYAQSRRLLKEREYWQKALAADVPFIPAEKLERDTFEHSTTLSIRIGPDVTAKLLRNANKAYNTEINDLLLTALIAAVRDITGENKLKVMMEGHGREDILDGVDITRTIGWFTTVYPVFIDLGEEKEISQNIKMVKETLRKIPNKGIGYGVLKYMTEELQKIQTQAPLSFNYFGEMKNDMNRKVFSQSPFSPGESIGGKIVRHCAIDMNAISLNGELIIYTTFNQDQYQTNTIEQLNQSFKENLEKIVDHCVDKEGSDMTPSDYGDVSLSLEELERIKDKYSAFQIEKIYPLANMQKGMLFHNAMDQTSGAYLQQMVIELKGRVYPDILEESFHEIVKRHEILRASFEYEITAEPRQIIARERKTPLTSIDLTGENRTHQHRFIETYLKEDQEKGFDLSSEALMRICLIKMNDESYRLIWSHHHILLDGWCLGIVMSELFSLYGKIMKGESRQLKEPKPYGDYIKWLEKQDQEEAAAYWKEYLKGYETRAELPVFNRGATSEEYGGKEKVISFSKELTAKIARIAKTHHVTINTVLQGIWSMILAKYNNTDEVVFGTVVSGREAPVDGIEEMVGLFIHTIPTRISFEGARSFKEVLKKTQAESIESNRYSYMNLSEIQDLSEMKRELITHVMAFQNYAFDEELFRSQSGETGFELEGVHGKERTNYDFNLTGVLEDEQLKLKLTFNENVYDNTIIETLEKHIITVAEQVAEDETQTLRDINLVSKEEQHRILHTFNDTKTDYPKDKPLHELFEEQAMKTPDHTALVFGAQRMTYRELNEKANQTARLLREKGIGRGSIAALIADRSFEMIIGIIGILKAGGTYLPIDPETPRDRIDYMLKNSGAALLVTTDSLLQPFDIKTVDLCSGELHLLSEENLPRVNRSSDTAYIVYTSGSTGTPKGVVIQHYSAVRVVKNTNYIDITEDDAILQLSNYSFDGSVFDIFGALLNGASLVLIEKETVLNTHELAEVIKKEQVSVMFITTALFNTLADINIGSLAKLRKILFGGERASIPHVRKVLDHVGRDKLIHVYGPTESTVYATYYFINEIDDEAETIPIGSPLANTSVLIMDEAGKLLPIGVPGELCIAGDGLSKGYLNREELTAEKFIPHPFMPGERLYKTGDLAKWLPDGNIEFIGRIDHQVKIRGFRIELGEIESRLELHEDINETIVIVREDEESRPYICAYITANREISLDELKGFLGEKLPDYMIPAYFVKMDKLPLTKNGKVDRKALPEPDGSAVTEAEYEAPRNYVEQRIISILEDVLGTERMGISCHFFDKGGNSLKAMQAVHSINKTFGIDMRISTFFKHPTAKSLARFVLTAEAESAVSEEYAEEEV